MLGLVQFICQKVLFKSFFHIIYRMIFFECCCNIRHTNYEVRPKPIYFSSDGSVRGEFSRRLFHCPLPPLFRRHRVRVKNYYFRFNDFPREIITVPAAVFHYVIYDSGLLLIGFGFRSKCFFFLWQCDRKIELLYTVWSRKVKTKKKLNNHVQVSCIFISAFFC